MSAADAIHPDQLRLFMRPHEIIAATAGSVETGEHEIGAGNRTKAHLEEKLQRARRPGTSGESASLLESVTEHGVQKPIILSNQGPNYTRSEHFWIGNGHHRLAAAQEAEATTGRQQYVPVIYDEDDFMGSHKTRETFGIAKD